MKFFNIRTYGILINARQEILISDELYHGERFSKFPGGGLELGESLPDAIKREFIEECDLQLDSMELLYVTDKMIKSAFDESQVIGMYYQVFTKNQLSVPTKKIAFDFEPDSEQSLRWISLQDFSSQDLTFPMDQDAWNAIKGKILL